MEDYTIVWDKVTGQKCIILEHKKWPDGHISYMLETMERDSDGMFGVFGRHEDDVAPCDA